MSRPTTNVLCPSWAVEAGVDAGFGLRDAVLPAMMTNRTQVHGADVHLLEGSAPESPLEGDGLWTAEPGLVVAVRTADCVPVLLYGPARPAVAAVHAGWRGTVAGIVPEAIRVARVELGLEAGGIQAAIGPAIGACCFEVGDEVVDGLRRLGLTDEQFGLREGPRGRPHVDIRAANRELLLREGVPASQIELVGECTYCGGQAYESYRRDGKASGRMHSFIGLPAWLALLCFMLLPACSENIGVPSGDSMGIEQVARQDAQPEVLAEDVTRAAAMSEIAERLAGGDAALAERLLREQLERYPDDAHAWGQLARALHLQGRDAEAVVVGRIGLGLDPSLWELAYNLACHHVVLGQFDRAIAWLQRAIVAGGLEPSEVAADPDLLPLRDDHRFAFYENTGLLSRAERDLLVIPSSRSVSVGDEVALGVFLLALNRPLMSERLSADLSLARPPEAGLIEPISRSERLIVGESGGREYSQHVFDFRFRATRPGLVELGPLRVVQGEELLYAPSTRLEVHAQGGREFSPSEGASFPAEEFFRSPSLVDEELADGLGEERVRLERFRAAGPEELPDSVKITDGASFRSVSLRRGTEGFSHLLEILPRH